MRSAPHVSILPRRVVDLGTARGGVLLLIQSEQVFVWRLPPSVALNGRGQARLNDVRASLVGTKEVVTWYEGKDIPDFWNTGRMTLWLLAAQDFFQK